jgi:NhaP-type Na+/H+ or K+/H+ antiporter
MCNIVSSPAITGFLPALHSFSVEHLTIYSVLIPPIILHAAYDLYHPAFLSQLPSVLTLAIIGTSLTTGLISLGLFFLYANFFNRAMNIYHILTFASFISAVDPVAVLAVFEQVSNNCHIAMRGDFSSKKKQNPSTSRKDSLRP